MRILSIILLSISLISCTDEPEARPGLITLKIGGQDCSGCESHLEASFFRINGVSYVEADAKAGTVSYKGSANLSEIKDALLDAAHHHGGGKCYQILD